jgi:16S rRNA (guanine527-N7)-methyltransferase
VENEMSEFLATLKQSAALAGLPLDDGLAAMLAQHWQLLQEANRRFNLTAINDEPAAAEKHYLDCLLAAQLADSLWPQDGSCADLGSGGGFPGLVLAATYPCRRFTLIEANRKKAGFLNDCAASLGLANLTTLPLRAEEAGRELLLRASFDCVTARAVAGLAVLAEYALPLLRIGGLLLAWKGPEPGQEIAAAEQALTLLGGKIEAVLPYRLPLLDEGRSLVVARKRGETPQKYPRRPGMPEKRPL